MSGPPRHTHGEVLRRYLDVRGKRVVDVGCGDGALVRKLAAEGARITGIECGAAALERAEAAVPAAEEDYLFGHGEALPLPDASVDILIYFNSLHHVPADRHAAALKEAARVIKQLGLLYVQEPLAQGSQFELVRPIDDETEVRAQAKQALDKAVASGRFVRVLEYTYTSTVRHPSFEAFLDRMVLVDASRREKLSGIEATLREAFEALGVRDEDGWVFEQPCRIDLLRRM